MRFPLALLAASVPTLHAAELKDAPPPNSTALLRELEEIERHQNQALERALRQALDTLGQGAASPSAAAGLYAKAVEVVQFQGMRDRVSAFQEWRKANAGLLRSGEFGQAAQWHLRYLMLSLERAAANDPIASAHSSLTYATQVATFLLELERQERVAGEIRQLLDRPVADGIFARWLALGPRLPKPAEWEPAAGHLPGILEKNVREPLRKVRDPALMEAWELQLRFEAERATLGRLAHEATIYNTVRRPHLLFQQAQDMASLGLKNRALQSIVALARTHPTHPDCSRWIQKARELLAAPAPEKALESEVSPP